MPFDTRPLDYPWPSRRTLVYGSKGMVAASQPLAAQAGLEILKSGGSAADAAVATAAALTVTEPTGCGLGGDAFALVWAQGRLWGLNASGPAPGGLTLETVRALGHETMPMWGVVPVTVPGQPAGWEVLSRRFGRLPFRELMAPAVRLAREGFPLSPFVSHLWQRAEALYRRELGEEARYWLRVFAPSGRTPGAGELFASGDLARTLERIGETRAADFYTGQTGRAIHDFLKDRGGHLTLDDLAAFRPEWVEPVSAGYRGFRVWEIPPNGQGLVVLMALSMLDGMDVGSMDREAALHCQIEAVKLAFADGLRHITQEDAMEVPARTLLSPGYTAARQARIRDRASDPVPGNPGGSDTVYLACADRDGMMVSYIQSNFMGFGSGLVVPGTGVALQNRGACFSLDPDHPNRLEPGKQPFHTIIPGFVTRDGAPVGPFGVMGGLMQPQAQVQVLMNMMDFGLNPQAALDAPRWQWTGGRKVSLESGFPLGLASGLRSRGHAISMTADPSTFGRGQIIVRNPETGVLCGATERRTDGHIAVW